MAKYESSLALIMVHLLIRQAGVLGECYCTFANTTTGLNRIHNADYIIACDEFTETGDYESCFMKVLEKEKIEESKTIHASLRYCDMDVLPEIFLASYNVITLQFKDCTMSKIPYNLLCTRSVRYLYVRDTPIPGSKLIPGGFKNCTRLLKMSLWNNELTDVSAESLRGLDSIVMLDFRGNRFLEVPELQGLGASLKYLHLTSTSIKSITKNAFRNLTNLEILNLSSSSITTIEEGSFDSLGDNVQVHLRDNSLHCDCSLKWLQVWFFRHPNTNDIPVCASPLVGPLKSTDFCASPTESSAQTSTGTNIQTSTETRVSIPKETNVTPTIESSAQIMFQKHFMYHILTITGMMMTYVYNNSYQ